MRLICVFILLLAMTTSANCQQNAEGWLSDLAPDPVMSWIEKSIALSYQGKYDEAIEAIDEAIRIDPNLARAWNVKGAILRNQGLALDDPYISLDGQDKYDEAMKCFDEAIRLDPNPTLAWIDKGIALLGQGAALTHLGLDGVREYGEATKCFDEAIRLNPNNSMVWHQKGVALSIMGQNTDAEAAYVKARDLGYEG